ncbi:alpha/beta fold hydrolase [Enterococcus sp. LJL51]|uniref:alpha/beta fold hydrolase n=1 Tax=Enterococcus sp. LJL51 TaxID=3416656 RepID=UPI003CED09B2
MSYFKYKQKNIYFSVAGEGEPVLFLHGNTSSSKMFEPLLPRYNGCRIILIDFLGYGKSDRVEEFPTNLWMDEARQVVKLIEHLNLKSIYLVGTSGGAWAAVNAGLLRPDLIKGVVADSFDGRTLHTGFAEELVQERATAQSNPAAAEFYEWCIGSDWQEVVAKDTAALLRLSKSEQELFIKPLSAFKSGLLLTASKEDKMIRPMIEQEYKNIQKDIPQAKIVLFDEGGHPAIGTNAEQLAQEIHQFIEEE